MAYIAHHGIKGQRWGIRRWQNPDGSLTPEGVLRYAKKNIKKSMSINLDKFGKDPEHNVLYVTGLSGSGKSTVALGIKKENDIVLHLDVYTNPKGYERFQSKEFNDYIDKRHPGLREKIDWDKNQNNHNEEYYNNVDNFSKAIEEYGAYSFSKGKRVIAEGIQIYNRFLRDDSTFYRDKPVVIITTNWKRALHQKIERDNTPKNQKENWTKWYLESSSQLTTFEKEILAEKGKKRVLNFLRR